MTRARHHMISSAISIGAISLTACSGIHSPLLKSQLEQNRTAQAKERWDHVRAGVKLQLAQQQFEAGRYVEARKCVEQVTGMDPQNVSALILSAKIGLEDGKLAQAHQAIQKAIALAPDNAETEFLAGLIAQRYGDVPTALVSFTAASTHAPQSLQYLVARTHALVAAEQLIDAQELIQTRMPDFDGDAQLRIIAARINYMLGLHAPAIEQAREAVELAPNDAPLKIELGEYLVWAQQSDEAVALLEPLLNSMTLAKPPQRDAAQEPNLRRVLARAYLGLSRWADAQIVIKPLMSQESLCPIAWFIYARAAVQAGDYDTAAAALANLRHMPSPPPEIWTLSSYVALRRGELEWSRADAEQALRLEPKSDVAAKLLNETARAENRARNSAADSDTSPGTNP